MNKRERDDVKLASDLRKMEKEDQMQDKRNRQRNRNRKGLEEKNEDKGRHCGHKK